MNMNLGWPEYTYYVKLQVLENVTRKRIPVNCSKTSLVSLICRLHHKNSERLRIIIAKLIIVDSFSKLTVLIVSVLSEDKAQEGMQVKCTFLPTIC